MLADVPGRKDSLHWYSKYSTEWTLACWHCLPVLLMVDGGTWKKAKILPCLAPLHKLPMAVGKKSAMPFLHGCYLTTLLLTGFHFWYFELHVISWTYPFLEFKFKLKNNFLPNSSPTNSLISFYFFLGGGGRRVLKPESIVLAQYSKISS